VTPSSHSRQPQHFHDNLLAPPDETFINTTTECSTIPVPIHSNVDSAASQPPLAAPVLNKCQYAPKAIDYRATAPLDSNTGKYRWDLTSYIINLLWITRRNMTFFIGGMTCDFVSKPLKTTLLIMQMQISLKEKGDYDTQLLKCSYTVSRSASGHDTSRVFFPVFIMTTTTTTTTKCISYISTISKSFFSILQKHNALSYDWRNATKNKYQNSLKTADFCLKFYRLVIHSCIYGICFIQFSKQFIQHLSNYTQTFEKG